MLDVGSVYGDFCGKAENIFAILFGDAGGTEMCIKSIHAHWVQHEISIWQTAT